MEKNSNMDFFLVVLKERGKEKEMKKGVLLFIIPLFSVNLYAQEWFSLCRNVL